MPLLHATVETTHEHRLAGAERQRIGAYAAHGGHDHIDGDVEPVHVQGLHTDGRDHMRATIQDQFARLRIKELDRQGHQRTVVEGHLQGETFLDKDAVVILIGGIHDRPIDHETIVFKQIAQLLSRHLAQVVNDNLKLDLPNDTLLSKVRVSAVSNGFLLDMTVDDTDPNRAQSIAQVWAQQFIEEHQADMAPLDPQDRIEIKLLDKPLAGALFFPKTKQYVLAAGVLGLIVGAVLAFVLEYLDDTLKTPEDVERFTSLPVVGSIPVAADVTSPAAKVNGRAKDGVLGGRR